MPRATAENARAGTLHVVATPIGHLEDITLRALKVLKTVNLIAAEDTRRTGALLRHYEISTPMMSVHEHNERDRVDLIIRRLSGGESVALVTDAGTPAISDPGAMLVANVRAAGFRVEPIPGPSAVIAAISAAGLQAEGFTFLGFPPNRSNNRNKWLFGAVEEATRRAVVVFEAPHRIVGTLQRLSELVNRPIIVARELTKIHEEIRAGLPAELAKHFDSPKGEFTIVIPKSESTATSQPSASDADVAHEFGLITLNGSADSRGEAVRQVAEKLGLSKKTVYAALERTKLVNRHKS